jgi:three-Cys-motif partner protein
MFYIDPFAGWDLNKFSHMEDVFVPCSPLVAWGFAKKSFDKLFLVEKDEKNCEALEERMRLVSHPENFEVIPGDANEKCELIMREVENTPKSHFFAFIDPITFETKWETVRRMLASGVRGDLIILLQTRRIAQNVGNVLKGRFKKVEFLNDFFGDNEA